MVEYHTLSLDPCDIVVPFVCLYRKMLEKCISQEEWRSIRKEIWCSISVAYCSCK